MTKLALLAAILFFIGSAVLRQQEAAAEFWQMHDNFGGYIGIRMADDDFLRAFEYIHEIDESRHEYGDDIVIWPLRPLLGFEFSRINDAMCRHFNDFYFTQGEILLALETLPQGHAILIRNHIGRSLWPDWAVSFLDNGGNRRHVGFVPDLSGEFAPWLFVEYMLEWGTLPYALPPKFNIIDGAKIDSRLDGETVDLIFRHFDAIERGDIAAFRETLQGQDGASLNMHIRLILAYFWNIVVGDYEDKMFFELGELNVFGRQRVFDKDFPPYPQDFEIIIEEIVFVGHRLYVTLTTDGRRILYEIGLLRDFNRPGIEWTQQILVSEIYP